MSAPYAGHPSCGCLASCPHALVNVWRRAPTRASVEKRSLLSYELSCTSNKWLSINFMTWLYDTVSWLFNLQFIMVEFSISGRTAIYVNTATWLSATVAIALRGAAIKKCRRPFQDHDYFIVAAYLFYIAFIVLLMYGMINMHFRSLWFIINTIFRHCFCWRDL